MRDTIVKCEARARSAGQERKVPDTIEKFEREVQDTRMNCGTGARSAEKGFLHYRINLFNNPTVWRAIVGLGGKCACQLKM